MIQRLAAAGVVLAAGAAAAGQCDTLPTLFSAGNGQAGAMFDLINIGTGAVRICNWDYRLFSGGGPGVVQGIEVYHRLGGYAGFETNPNAWTLLGSASVQTVAAPGLIRVDIGDLVIQPGERYGIYFTRNNTGSTLSIAYTNGNGSNQVYEDGTLRLEAGVGKSYPFGSTFTPRVWNGNVQYQVEECYPDCDTSTGVGVLDVFDFLCFQNRYDAGSPYACDCDTSTGVGMCDVFDFLCFQNAYDAGCP